MLERLTLGAMGANCYLYMCDNTREGIVIDPGAGAERIKHWVREKKADVRYIFLTHGHLDHIGAVEELRNAFGVLVGIHVADGDMLTDPKKNLSAFWGKPVVGQPADLFFQDGEILKIGNKEITVIHTPGHSPGSVCFFTPEGLISGDTLFAQSVGRTDFPGGSMAQLVSEIKSKLLIMPESTRVFPGHGEETTIGWEKLHNPYLA